MIELRKPLTRAGHTRLAEEHYQLAKVERPKVVDAIATAAAEGDRSENAEYIYGKKRLRELDKRLRYLNGLLKDAQIIDPDSLGGVKVAFSSTVKVWVEDDERVLVWTIVGEGESDYRDNTISWQSPVAKALLGKGIGDVVEVLVPRGEMVLEIKNMRFGSQEWIISE